MIKDTEILLITLQAIFSREREDLELPWAVNKSTDEYSTEWLVYYRLGQTHQQAEERFALYITLLRSAQDRAIYPGLYLCRPTLAVIDTLGSLENTVYLFSVTIGAFGSGLTTLWQAPSELQVALLRGRTETQTITHQFAQLLENHPLLGHTNRHHLRIDLIETDLLEHHKTLTVYASRKEDPNCKLPLSRNLDDYALSPEAKVTEIYRTFVQHHSVISYPQHYWVIRYQQQS